MESRQAKKRENACLRCESGIRASKKERECLPEMRKWNSGKQKRERMLAQEAKVEFRQVKKRENACLGSEKGIQASKKCRKCLPEM